MMGVLKKRKWEGNWAGAKGQGEVPTGAAEKKEERRVERRGLGGGQRATDGRGEERDQKEEKMRTGKDGRRCGSDEEILLQNEGV